MVMKKTYTDCKCRISRNGSTFFKVHLASLIDKVIKIDIVNFFGSPRAVKDTWSLGTSL